MAIEFQCPNCAATVRVGEQAAGRKGRCPGCRALLRIPKLPSQPAPVPPPVAAETSFPFTAPEDPTTAPAPDSVFDAPPVFDEPPVFDAPVRRGSRDRVRKPGGRLPGIVAAVVGFALVIGIGWFVLNRGRPSLSGAIAGARLSQAYLPAVALAPPTGQVPASEIASVLDAWDRGGLPIKSEFIEVTFTATDRQPQVRVVPGPQAQVVRVSLSTQPAVMAAVQNTREQILKLKAVEMQTATAALFRDYAAYLRTGQSLGSLAPRRDAVGLNATVGALGYAVEAVVAGVTFRCGYQDAEGRLYFYLPRGYTTFQIRGRRLADGSTPLPLDYQITIANAPAGSEPENPTTEQRPGAMQPPAEPEVDGLAPVKPKSPLDPTPTEPMPMNPPAMPDNASADPIGLELRMAMR